MRTKTLLAIFGMIASTFALFIKIMTPSSVQFIIEGNIVELNQVPSIYNTLDMLLIGVSCFVLGASLVHLLRGDEGLDAFEPRQRGRTRNYPDHRGRGGHNFPEPTSREDRILEEQG